jgi:hypothetical protein
MRSFSPKQDVTLRKWYDDGFTASQLAKKKKVTIATVCAAIRRAGGEIYNGGIVRYHWDSRREARLWTRYRITFNDCLYLFRNQKGACLWCEKLLPLENLLKCCIDHRGGNSGLKNRQNVRGLCCPNGGCNLFAGQIEANFHLTKRIVRILQKQSGSLFIQL